MTLVSYMAILLWVLSLYRQNLDLHVSDVCDYCANLLLRDRIHESDAYDVPNNLAASKLACLALSSARSCRSGICLGRLSTAWLVSLVIFSCRMVWRWWHVRSIGRLWRGLCALPRTTSFQSHGDIDFFCLLVIHTYITKKINIYLLLQVSISSIVEFSGKRWGRRRLQSRWHRVDTPTQCKGTGLSCRRNAACHYLNASTLWKGKPWAMAYFIYRNKTLISWTSFRSCCQTQRKTFRGQHRH